VTRRARRAARGGTPANDRGSALIAVTMIGLVAVLAVSSLAGRVVTEHRAVEDSLAQLRLYWAGMGHANYLLSRTMQVGPCGGAKTCSYGAGDFLRRGTWMLDEVTGLRNWRYPETGAAYAFTLAPVLSENPAAKGRWRVGIAFGRPAGAVEALRVAARTPSLELAYLLLDQDGSSCIASSSGETCKTQLVASVHRGARPSD
jgi:hypothetical protein